MKTAKIFSFLAICILSVQLLAVSAFAFAPTILFSGSGTTASSQTCEIDDSYTSQSTPANWSVARYVDREYIGIKYTPASNMSVCQVDWYCGSIAGDLSGDDYYTEIWTTSGDNLVSLVSNGRSTVFPGENITNSTYNSFGFDNPVALSSGTTYAILVKRLDQGDPSSTAGEYAEYPRWYMRYDDNAGAVARFGGKFYWSSATGAAHGDSNYVDHPLIRIYSIDTPPAPTTYYCGSGSGSCPDATKGADRACETFEDATNYDCKTTPQWLTTLDGGSVNWNHTPSGSWTCTDEDDENVQFTTSGVSHIELDLGTNYDRIFGVLYFKVTSESIVNNNSDYAAILSTANQCDYVGEIRLFQESDNDIYFKVCHKKDGSVGQEADFNCYNIGSIDYYTLGQEIRVRFDSNSADGSGVAVYYVSIGSNPERTISFTENETNDSNNCGYIRYVGFGTTVGNQSNFTVELNNVRLDDDSMPGICTGDAL